MSKPTFAAIAILLLSPWARADMVTERWGSSQQCRHGDSAEWTSPSGGGLVVKFDLSALPKGAKVYRARLLPYVKTSGFPMPAPIVVKALKEPCPDGAAPALEDKGLELTGPRFTSFDATDVAQRWTSGKLANNGLFIGGAAVVKGRTFLEITYEGQLKDPPPPATGLKASARAGQVFLTWKEVNCKFAGQDEVVWKDYRDETQRIRDGRGPITTYRIYRHTKPITPGTIAGAELLDEVAQYSCFDERMVQTEWKGEQIKNVKVDDARVPRTAAEPNTELPVGTGVYVKTTAKDGEYYYAAVATVDGFENTANLDAGCATPQPIKEQVAPTEPIPFKAIQMQYQQDRFVFCYVWWVEQPLAHLPNFIHVGVSAGPKMGNPPAAEGSPNPDKSGLGTAPAPAEQAKQIEELVKQLAGDSLKSRQEAEQELVKIGPPAVAALEQAQKSGAVWGPAPKPGEAPDEAQKARIAEARRDAARTLVEIRVRHRDKASPAPLLVHGYWWSGGWNSVHPCPQEDGVTLALDDHPWQFRGIHDANGTYKAWSQGKVQNFYIRQVKALLPWMQAKYNADMDRVYAFSGGWAWHYPEIFAATFEVLSMNPKRSPAYSSVDGRGPGEVQFYWGSAKAPVPTEWGVSPYEYWDASGWIRNNPTAELAFMSYTPYQHTGDFGRLDKPAFYAAMRDTKRAFATTFDEGRGWYGTADAGWIFQIRKSDSVAAFTNCTLDDDPGIGAGGDPGGQINGWPAFDARGQKDEPDKWEMTLYLVGPERNRPGAPLDACTADVTPRRCQKFKGFKPGEKFAWTNTSLADNKVVQTGQATADQHGLVTAEKVTITKGKNRLAIQREK